MNKRKIKDGILQGLIYFSTGFTVLILVVILGFVLYKGLPEINLQFLTRMWDSKTTFVKVEKQELKDGKEEKGYIPSLGITIDLNKDNKIYIDQIDKKSPVNGSLNLKGDSYPLKKGDIITKVNSTIFEDITLEDAAAVIDEGNDLIKLKVVRPGGGIIPMLVTTIYIIVLSLLISAPVGILAAIYLNEYARPGRLLNVIRFAIQNLAGIPSIIYGLFGMLVFVQMLRMQYSILAGALTLSIILLPTLISTTEETLKAIPATYRESSLGLGATKLQTVYKVVLPGALPGILVAIILSIGRIVGESAALLLTAGTVAQIPGSLTGNEAAGATLTTKLYWLIKESGDLSGACGIAIVLLVLVILLNIISKSITKHFLEKQGNR